MARKRKTPRRISLIDFESDPTPTVDTSWRADTRGGTLRTKARDWPPASRVIPQNGWEFTDKHPRFPGVFVLAKEGREPLHPNSVVTVAEVAEAAEFGIGQPARPFVSAWADEHGAAFVTRMRRESEAAVKARQSPATRLDALAQVAAGEIQSRFPVPPPNAQATIDRKGFDSPLIDKGQLRSSILGKVGKK